MNLFNILSDIEKRDAEAYERVEFTRRNLLKTTAVAAVGTTGFLATTLNKAFAADSEVVDVLNFALTLEYLEAEFYEMGLSKGGLIPEADRMVFMKIGEHEKQHVEFLKSALGGSAVGKPTFDFTAGGKFADVFSNYATFLVLSQSFEDLGVRAYKGQAPRLKGNQDVLLSALKIHSVEARHAADVRLIRGLRVWASEQETGGAPAAVYEGENNIRQHDLVDLISVTAPRLLVKDGSPEMVAEKIVREAFDEPLTKEKVLAIAGPFIK
ncbi:ferritin-like domain-containing protein [Spirosoma oryzicola]|uniref:ferritin-like domain-containing protein n=1 Tax=Spirosoma oryzicola TaxID=2898794 RepID=UPI001E343C6C|nr:ferritin-like domain-containing protein [Spirosoma oryzicola]UHG93581.1 ferritin-like domain-containing protein [Spirosoma oryzicola]